MKLVAWNIRHGGRQSAPLAAAIMAHEPDLIVLGEYRTTGSESLLDQFRFFGWSHIHASAVTGITNGVAILSRNPIDQRPPPFASRLFDQWAVEAAVPAFDLTVIGVYAPLASGVALPQGTQREFWKGVHRLVEHRQHERVLLVGDFNTDAPSGTGGQSLPCSDAIQQLSTLGWLDAWRARNPGDEDFSYVHRAASGHSNWRIDHAFVSPPLSHSNYSVPLLSRGTRTETLRSFDVDH